MWYNCISKYQTVDLGRARTVIETRLVVWLWALS